MYGRSFLSGSQIFSLSPARNILNVPPFLISYPSLKFTIFLYLSPYTILLALLFLAVCRIRVKNLGIMTYTVAHHMSPSSSVVRASDQHVEGRGLIPIRDSHFSLFHAHDMLNITPFIYY